MQWNGDYTEGVHTFANTINTHEGGAHEEGFRTSLTSLVNRYARERWNLLKDKDPNLSGEDIREGLTAIVSIKLREPQFEGQTKTKLGNADAKTFVQKVTNDQLAAWFDANPAEGKEIARKSINAATARIAARKARDLARNRKGLLGGGGLPGKLIDCSSNNPEECEVFVVEGDSAGGSARNGRNPQTQAILPIRGKILNVEKARIDRVLQNNEVQAMISALGHRCSRGVRPRQAALPQDRADGRRRRRRSAHPHAAADAALPIHASPHRRGLRLPGAAATLQDQVVARRRGVRLQRPRARRAARSRRSRWTQDPEGGGHPAVQGSRAR